MKWFKKKPKPEPGWWVITEMDNGTIEEGWWGTLEAAVQHMYDIKQEMDCPAVVNVGAEEQPIFVHADRIVSVSPRKE